MDTTRSSSKREIKISLRLRHPSLPASRLIEQVGLEPFGLHDVGATPVTSGKAVPWAETYCSFPLNVPSVEDANTALAEGIDILERAEGFWMDFLATGGSIDYFVGIFVEPHVGWTIDPDLIARMGKWKIALGLDIYEGRKRRR